MKIGVIGTKHTGMKAELCSVLKSSGKGVVCADRTDEICSIDDMDAVILADYRDADYCNEVSKCLNVKVISYMTALEQAIKRKCICKIAILADSGLIESEVFQNGLDSMDIILLMPQEEEQQWVDRFKMNISSGTETFTDKNDVLEVVENLKNFGGQSIIVADEVLYQGIKKYDIKGNFIYPVNEIVHLLDEMS